MEKTRHDSAVRPLQILPATVDDHGAMCAIHVSSILAINGKFYSLAQKQSWAAGLTATGYSKAKDESFHAAKESDGKVRGFSSTRLDQLLALYVAPQWHGQGIGSSLLQQAEHSIAGHGHEKLRLKASRNAEAFYAKHGWITVGAEDYLSRGGLTLPILLMEKAFGGNFVL